MMNKNSLLERLLEVKNLSQVLKEFDVSENTHYQWLMTDEMYRLDFEDHCHSILMESIKRGCIGSICLFLTLFGKDRGYDMVLNLNEFDLTHDEQMALPWIKDYFESKEQYCL